MIEYRKLNLCKIIHDMYYIVNDNEGSEMSLDKLVVRTKRLNFKLIPIFQIFRRVLEPNRVMGMRSPACLILGRGSAPKVRFASG